jgi:hypothetical protein
LARSLFAQAFQCCPRSASRKLTDRLGCRFDDLDSCDGRNVETPAFHRRHKAALAQRRGQKRPVTALACQGSKLREAIPASTIHRMVREHVIVGDVNTAAPMAKIRA